MEFTCQPPIAACRSLLAFAAKACPRPMGSSYVPLNTKRCGWSYEETARSHPMQYQLRTVPAWVHKPSTAPLMVLEKVYDPIRVAPFENRFSSRVCSAW